MTSRGNPSISPPAQISQQRHGNALPSGTPPPQQYFPGQPPALPQGPYDYIPSQQLLSYQAYGSAVNDVRSQPGNGVRGAPPQQTMHQGGAAFYQQPGQNMRSQHPQTGPINQQVGQYFISTGQSNMRPRPHHPNQSQAMVYIPQTQHFAAGNNVVIAGPNVYPQRAPLNYFTPVAQSTAPMYYFTNGAGAPWRAPSIQQQVGPAYTREKREKKILEIKDPATGKDLTEELKELSNINAGHGHEHHHETEEDATANPTGQEIGKLFTRLVAETLKPPSEDSAPPEVGSMPPAQVVPSSQQYQQLPPPGQQPPQQMMRPAMNQMGPPRMPPPGPMNMPPRPMMPQQQPQGQPPAADMAAPHQMNFFSRPPPHISMRHRAPVSYAGGQQQQHQVMHPPQMRPPSLPPMQPAQPLVQQQQQPQLPPVPVHSQQPAVPQQVLPSQPEPVAVQPTAPTPPANVEQPPVAAQAVEKPEVPAPSEEDNVVEVKASEPEAKAEPVVSDVGTPVTTQKEAPVPEVSSTTAADVKDDSAQGASNRAASKDVRKGKKKRDLNTKEIGGSDMDAFIDEKENDVSGAKPPLPPQPASATESTTSTEKSSPPSEANPVAQAPAPQPDVSPAEVEPEPVPEASSPQLSVEESVSDVKPSGTEAPSTPVEIEVAEPSTAEKDIEQPAVSEKSPEAVVTTSNQNQSPPSESTSTPEPSGKPPLNNGISAEAASKSSPADKDKVEVANTPSTPVNDENAPPQVEEKEAPVTGTDETEPSPAKAPAEKPEAPAKRDANQKLTYDRAYLMELRDCASSQTKPEGLPNLEIILDRPVNRGPGGAGPSPDFTPTFFQPSTPQRHPPQMGKSASRGRGRPGDNLMPQRIIKSVSIQNDVKALHQSEKPWKPTQKQLATGEVQSKDAILEKKALFIMNRLTPTNFEPLSQEMIDMKIGDYEQLQLLVKIIFDKVALETKFVEAYAKLCKKMAGIKVPPPPGLKENQATFRVLLLTKCQNEFESDKAVVFEDPEEKRKKLEAELPDAPDKKEQIETKLYHMKLRRLKFYGNIRFIGELFKLQLLTENIMHDCIYRLLKAGDDESLLSLCQLITTVGQILDTEKAKQRMDQYFYQMTKLSKEKKSRIKFTLKDAIELRDNHWVPRKETTGPKKIDEVRQDFKHEQITKQIMQSQPAPPRNDPQPGSRRGSRQRQQEEKPSDDGWNTVGAKSMKIDASKLKFSKTVVDDNVQLGPGGGMNKFSLWGRGSGTSQASQDSPLNRPSNRYSALTSEEDRRNFQRSPSRDSSGIASRGQRQGNTAGHGRGKMLGRSSIEGERRDALASARSIVGGRSQNSSRDNSWNREDRRSFGPRGSREGDSSMGPPRTISLRPSTERAAPPPAPSPAAAAGVKRAAPKSEEEMEQSAKTIMDEYLNIRDMKEAKLCVMELEGQKFLHTFITASINNVLERTDKERTATGQFFAEIMKDNLISLEKYIKGLGEVLQFAEDMVIDIPKMWTNLAQLITPALVGGAMPWSQLQPTLEPHLTPMCAAKLWAEVLLIAKTLVSEAEVARSWQSSGTSFEFLLPADRVADFIKDKKLEFLQGSARTSAPEGSISQDGVVNDLVKMIQEVKSNDDINSYIKNKVPAEMEGKSFVRLLVTAVSKASLSANNTFSSEVITNRQELLQKYIKTPELELQALFAIQALMHLLEHPKNAIAGIFEALCTEDVISEETFKQWDVSNDEPEGKGTCSMQLRRFFAWLRENEDIETS